MAQRRTSPPLCFIGWICPLDSLRWRVLVWPSAARPLVSRQAHARISNRVFGPYFTGRCVQQKGAPESALALSQMIDVTVS